MRIFRHCYTDNEVNSINAPLLKDLSSWGFVNRDGTQIVYPTTDESGQSYDLRYKLDTKNDFYLHIYYTPNQNGHYSMLGDWYVHNTAGINKDFLTKETNYVERQLPIHAVFLPLKDNGFYLNLTQGADVGKDTWTPLPNLNSYLINTSGRNRTIHMNLIGLPPKGQQSNWIYLYWILIFNKGIPGSRHSDAYGEFDFGNGITSLCFDSLNEYNFLSGTTDLNFNSEYININQNTCSLIKMPYNTGYIENFYLLATAPQDIKPGTFFSFSGRNFLNIFGNYVVELPSQ